MTTSTIKNARRTRQHLDDFLRSSPGFIFYPKDWCSSRRVQNMSFSERGMFLELLCEQWNTGAVPAVPEQCATLLDGTPDEWERAWPRLQTCFEVRKNGRMVNLKLERVRQERIKFLKAKREIGLRGAKMKWQKHRSAIGQPSGKDGSAIAKHGRPIAKNGYRSDLISTGSDLISTRSDRNAKRTPPTPSRGRAREAEAREDLREGFDAFWHAYPKKFKQASAWQAWQALKPDATLLAQIVAALAWQCQQDAWLRERGRFVPLPSTWLSEKRWLDEPTKTPQVSNRTLALRRAGQDFLS